MYKVTQSIADFYLWWVSELNNLVRRSGSSGTAAGSTLLVSREANGIIRADSAANLKDSHSTGSPLPNKQYTVELMEGRGLVRHLSGRRMPYHQALQMAALDLVEETPFNVGGVHVMLEQPTSHTIGTRYLVVRRDHADPIFEQLADRRARLNALFANADGQPKFQATSRCLDRIAPNIAGSRQSRRITLLTAFAILALTISVLTELTYTYHSASAALDEQLEGLQQRASKIRKELDLQAAQELAVTQAQSSKSNAASISRIWAELTQILPQSTWLTTFSVQNGLISIEGYSEDAPVLIRLLDESSHFTETRFTSSVMHMPGSNGDHFSIQTKVASK